MKIADLKKSMDARFESADARFENIDARFDSIDRRFAAVDARFDRVDARFDTLEARMVAWEQTIRRHFDIIAEQLRGDIKLLYDTLTASQAQIAGLTATNAQDHGGFVHIFDNHEVRIQALERKSN